MKLIVLAGANQGTVIPIKKDKFVIGRSSECTLRAGSGSISRHHCALLQSKEGLVVRDLKSRNGTYVNGERLTGDKLLKNGDLISVGSLEVRFEYAHDIDRSKKPKVQNVAEAVSRSAELPESSGVIEEDISRWLIGTEPESSSAMRDTQTIRFDDTQAIPKPKMDPITAEDESEEKGEESNEKKGDKKGKKEAKAAGKLPPLPSKTTKDSREAAVDILREMTRRR